MQSSALIKEARKTVPTSILTDVTSLSAFYSIPSVIALCISHGPLDGDAIMPLPSSRTLTEEIPEKNTQPLSAKRCKMNQERKSKREEKKSDNRAGHGGCSMYLKPQIVTENCLIFKSQRLFAPRIPFFASVVLRQNGNAD